MASMAGREGRFSARILASSLSDKPTGTDVDDCEYITKGEEYRSWTSAPVATVAGSQGCGRCRPVLVIGSPGVMSGLLGTNGVTSNPEATSMIPLENVEDRRILYFRRYHMNPRTTAPSSKMVAIALMTGLATALTCDFFECGAGAVGCGAVVVVLNWISLTGILRMVSQPWKIALSTKYGLLEQRRKHCALCCADKEMTTIFSMSCEDSELTHVPIP